MSSGQEHLPVPYCVHVSASWLIFTSFDHTLVWFGSLSHRRLPALGYHPCVITQHVPILGRVVGKQIEHFLNVWN